MSIMLILQLAPGKYTFGSQGMKSFRSVLKYEDVAMKCPRYCVQMQYPTAVGNATNQEVNNLFELDYNKDDEYVIKSIETLVSKADDKEKFGILVNIDHVLLSKDQIEFIHHRKVIGVPMGQAKEHWKKPPNKLPNKTKLDIEMLDVEIIDFNFKRQEFTMRMNFKIIWPEKRFNLLNSSLVYGWFPASYEVPFWSPQIDIRSHVAHKSRTKELIEVGTDSQTEVSLFPYQQGHDKSVKVFVQSFYGKMTFFQTTTVKCNMNLEMFPNDTYSCKLEVSS